MKDKEKQIEEMAKHGCYDGCASGLRKFCDEYDGKPCKNMVRIASGLYEQGYRKIDKDSVVLTREEYIDLSRNYVREQIEQASKKTAEKILERGKYCMPSGLREWIVKQFGVEIKE